jgi:integrase
VFNSGERKSLQTERVILVPGPDEETEIVGWITEVKGYVIDNIPSIRTALTRACRDAGIPYGRGVKDGFIFHDTRHCFNTNMRKSGVPESVIMKITGHSTREMFLRYDTVDATETRKAVDQMEGFLKSVDQTVDQVPLEATRG